MPRTRTEFERATKEADLLDVAERLFNTHGYAGTTTSQLASTAGVAPNAVYWYFPSKDDLFAAVLNRMLDQLLADLRLRRGRPLVEQVAYAAERLERTQALNAAVADRARHSDAIAQFAMRMQKSLRDTLLHAVVDAAELAGKDAEVVTDSILAVVRGAHGMSKRARRQLLAFAIPRLVRAAT